MLWDWVSCKKISHFGPKIFKKSWVLHRSVDSTVEWCEDDNDGVDNGDDRCVDDGVDDGDDRCVDEWMISRQCEEEFIQPKAVALDVWANCNVPISPYLESAI